MKLLSTHCSRFSEWSTGWCVRLLNLAMGNISSSPPKRPYLLRYTPSLLFNGYRVSIPRVSRLGREVDRSPPPSADVKNEWRYTFTTLIRLSAIEGKICLLNYVMQCVLNGLSVASTTL